MIDVSRQPLTEIFCAIAAANYDAFPARAGNLMIASLTDPIYVSPDIAGLLSYHAGAAAWLIQANADAMLRMDADGLSGLYPSPQGNIQMITFRPDFNTASFVSSKHPREINAIDLLLHEVGHRVVPAGNGDEYTRHQHECAADAYTVLCHLKYFGDTTDILEYYARDRSTLITAGSSRVHYTTTVIDRIATVYRSGEIDPASMSLQDIAAYANTLALQYSLPSQVLYKVYSAFAPVRVHFKDNDPAKEDWDKIICETAAVMMKHKDDHDIYRAGKLLLNGGRHRTYLNENPELQKLFAFMPQHEEQSGFILNAADALDATRTEEERQKAAQPPHWIKGWLHRAGNVIASKLPPL